MSDLICCTQLPGTPEILKMSLATCDPRGGDELWMIGKNFMKDAIVTFQDQDRTWVRTVPPIKEFFNATHLIVMIPPFYEQRLTQPYKVKFLSPLSQPSGCHWGVPLRGATVHGALGPKVKHVWKDAIHVKQNLFLVLSKTQQHTAWADTAYISFY